MGDIYFFNWRGICSKQMTTHIDVCIVSTANDTERTVLMLNARVHVMCAGFKFQVASLAYGISPSSPLESISLHYDEIRCGDSTPR